MHIFDHHIKVYYNIEKRKLVKIEIEIYGGTEIHRRGQKWTTTVTYTPNPNPNSYLNLYPKPYPNP